MVTAPPTVSTGAQRSGEDPPGVCGCGIADTDSDHDGTPDCIDQCPMDPGKIAPGACGCGNFDTPSCVPVPDHIVFMSSTTYTDAFASDPASYSDPVHAEYDGMNSRCQAVSAATGLGGEWLALQTYSPGGPKFWRVLKFQGGGSVLMAVTLTGATRDTVGTLIFANPTAFTSASFSAPIQRTETGAQVSGTAWTYSCVYDFLLHEDVGVYATATSFADPPPPTPPQQRASCALSKHLMCFRIGDQ